MKSKGYIVLSSLATYSFLHIMKSSYAEYYVERCLNTSTLHLYLLENRYLVAHDTHLITHVVVQPAENFIDGIIIY